MACVLRACGFLVDRECKEGTLPNSSAKIRGDALSHCNEWLALERGVLVQLHLNTQRLHEARKYSRLGCGVGVGDGEPSPMHQKLKKLCAEVGLNDTLYATAAAIQFTYSPGDFDVCRRNRDESKGNGGNFGKHHDLNSDLEQLRIGRKSVTNSDL